MTKEIKEEVEVSEPVLTREELEVVELRELVAKLESLGLKSIGDIENRIANLSK